MPAKHFPQTQKIFFNSGERITIEGVIAVRSGRWTHLLVDGGTKEIIINNDNVLYVEVTPTN